MAGIGIKYDLGSIERLQKRIEEIGAFSRRDLLDVVGATAESMFRRRIEEEKTGPDGTAWPNWSERYAGTRHGGHSLLIGDGDQLDSLGYFILLDGSAVEVGSNLIYFATHDQGDESRGIPQRQVLGFSPDNEAELAEVIDNWIDSEVLQ